MNVYSYGLNNPLSFTDPLGLEATFGDILGAGARGAGKGARGMGGKGGWRGAAAAGAIGAAVEIVKECTKEDKEKDLCDKEYRWDVEECYDHYGNGLRGAGFTSNLKGCLDWAASRRNACYTQQPDPGPYPGYRGDNGPQGR